MSLLAIVVGVLWETDGKICSAQPSSSKKSTKVLGLILFVLLFTVYFQHLKRFLWYLHQDISAYSYCYQ